MRLRTPRQQRKSHNRHNLKAHQEYPSRPHPISQPARCDSEEACTHIWWDRHELCLVGGIAHLLNDGRQEQGEAVYGSKAGHADEAVNVYLPVLERLEDVLVGEFVVEVAVVDV